MHSIVSTNTATRSIDIKYKIRVLHFVVTATFAQAPVTRTFSQIEIKRIRRDKDQSSLP